MWRVGHASARVPETLYAFADGAGSTLIWIHANGDGGAAQTAIFVRDTTDALCRGLEARLDQWQRDSVILPVTSAWLESYRRAFQAHAVLRESERAVALPPAKDHVGPYERWEALFRIMRADASQHGFETQRAQYKERPMAARKSMDELRHATPKQSAFLQRHRALIAEHAVAQIHLMLDGEGVPPPALLLPRAMAEAVCHHKGEAFQAVLEVQKAWGGTTGKDLQWTFALLHILDPKHFPFISRRLDAAAAFAAIHIGEPSMIVLPTIDGWVAWMEAMGALRRRLRLRDFGELTVRFGYIEAFGEVPPKR